MKHLKSVGLALGLSLTVVGAQNPYFDAIQLKNSRFQTYSLVILTEIQDADVNQIDGLQAYTLEYSKNFSEFSNLLGQSNSIISELRVKFNEAKLSQLKIILTQMDTLIEQSKKSNQKIRHLISEKD
jgi:hypothetical protein